MKFWRHIIALLAVLWIVAAVIVHFARSAQPTAESMKAYLNSHPVSAKKDRPEVIEHVAGMLNRVTFDERQQLQRSTEMRRFFNDLQPTERSAFLDATLPAGFQQMMNAFNKMDPARRKKIVERSLAEMKKREGEGPPPDVDEKLTQKMINEGMRSFYSDASADVKLDLAPLIEQMQRNLQSTH